MPNSSVYRVENCYMPPKKSAWRFENSKISDQSTSETKFAESEKIKHKIMGIMSEDSKMKPVDQIQFYPSVGTFPHIKNEQSEDAPLDFSIKKANDSRNESVSHLMNPLNYKLKESDNASIHPPVQLLYPDRKLNGITSQSPINNSTTLLDTSRASSSPKDSDSLDLECSQETVKSPSRLTPYVDRVYELSRASSPEHASLSRENSPTSSQPSILEGMLRGQQQSNMGNNPQSFRTGYPNGLGIFESQIVASPSPPMGVGAPVMHPANMLPLAMAPYFGYGYVDHANPFMPGYMYNPAETNMSDVSSGRKMKKKIDPLADSLKSCSIDDLRKKLISLSGGSALNNPEHAIKPAYIPQNENRRHFSNNSTPETVKHSLNNSKNCSDVHENGVADNSVENHSPITSKAHTNHKKESDATVTDINLNRNNQTAVNHSETNFISSTENVSSIEDMTDSIPSAMLESPSDDRKRKSIPDYKNDPQYRMKRAKNNLAARRSRESRRIKEELVRKTANILEQQNKVIIRDLTALRFTYDETQVKYFALLKEYENIKIQNSVLVERLNQKRCGQCGTALPNVN